MEIRQLALEDAYRELNNIVGVVVVTTDGPGSFCVEHKDAQDAIEEFLNGTTWAIIETTDLAGQYPRAYVGPPTEHREDGR
jgi:hypothetical protein